MTKIDGKCQNWNIFKLTKLAIFGIFIELLSTKNVNVADFARNVECDFINDFQTLCIAENLQRKFLSKLN